MVELLALIAGKANFTKHYYRDYIVPKYLLEVHSYAMIVIYL